jgi:hypothetical protein
MFYEVIARWESKTGKHWAELHHDGTAAFYRGEGCGGNMGICDKDSAISVLQMKVDSGYFLPDSAKTPMKRVK